MAEYEVMNQGRTSEGLPQAPPETGDADLRVNRYGDQFSIPILTPRQAMAREGSYWVATTPAPGTAVAATISTSFSDTVAFFAIKNTEIPGTIGAKSIYLDQLSLLMSGTAPTATTVMHFAFKRSTVDREPTTAANKTVLTPVCMNSAMGRASIARIVFYSAAAAMTVPASSVSDPVLGRCSIPTSLGITGDEYVLRFGADDIAPTTSMTAVRATAAARLTAHAPPIIIAPGEWVVCHRWWLTEATNGPSFEWQLGYIER